ncbi:putative RiPP precursor [Verrucosispora sp. FIM060022]|nr:putative RiPP precursor [Verrucosispora sp. FIM060022]
MTPPRSCTYGRSYVALAPLRPDEKCKIAAAGGGGAAGGGAGRVGWGWGRAGWRGVGWG